jgi:hypothetical protein
MDHAELMAIEARCVKIEAGSLELLDGQAAFENRAAEFAKSAASTPAGLERTEKLRELVTMHRDWIAEHCSAYVVFNSYYCETYNLMQDAIVRPPPLPRQGLATSTLANYLEHARWRMFFAANSARSRVLRLARKLLHLSPPLESKIRQLLRRRA